MHSLKDDFTSPEARESGISGALVPDQNGYVRAILTDTTRDAVKRSFGELIDSTIKDYREKIDPRREANIEAYEARSSHGEAITIPIVKRDTNQQLAWLIDAIFSKEPPFSVRALDNDPVQVLVDEGAGPQIISKVADEYAAELQALINYFTLHKLGFKKTLRTFISELLRDGNRPPILKVLYEEREREIGSLNVITTHDGTRIERIEKDPVFRSVKDGEPTRIEGIPGEKFFIPLPWDDIQRAPFILQEYEERTETIKDKIARGVYDFCREEPDQEEIDRVLTGFETDKEFERWRADGRRAADPLKSHKLYEMHFDYPFATIEADPTTGEPGEVAVRMVPFCAVIHAATKIWLNCYESFYWHRKRPFFAGRMQDRPYSFAGYSTAENVAPFQRLISQLFQAQLQNLAISNIKILKLKEGSPAWHQLYDKKTGSVTKIRPGMGITVRELDDISLEALGTPVGSQANEIGFLNSESEKMSVVTQYDRGHVPGRTPVGTISAVDELAKMQPRMVLDQLRDVIGEVLEIFIRTLAQFNPDGVPVPFRDPEQSEGPQIRVVGFPIEWREGVFSFGITATGEEETSQALLTRDLMFSDQISKFNDEVMGILAAAAAPGTPPPITVFAMSRIMNRRNMLANALRHAKLNPDDYLPKKFEIESLPVELMQLQMLAQQLGQGGTNGDPSAAAGGEPVPPGDGGPQAAPVMAGEPNDSGASGVGQGPSL